MCDVTLHVRRGEHASAVGEVDELHPTFLTLVDDSLRPRLESTTIRFRLLFPGGRATHGRCGGAWLGFNLSHRLGLLTTGVVMLSLALHDRLRNGEARFPHHEPGYNGAADADREALGQ
jgi:hypothetical protein